MTNDILVFAEQRTGKVNPVTYQAFSVAKHLATKTGGAVHACIIGKGVREIAAGLGGYGAKKVFVADDAELEFYRALPYARALTAAIDAPDPRIVLLPATFMGRDLAPRVAARKRAALATDCVSVDVAADGLHVRRTLFSGKVFGEYKLVGDRLQMVSIRANAFPAAPKQDGSPEIVNVPLLLTDSDRRLQLTEIVRTGSGVKDVTEAEIVVSGGRSLKSEANFKIIYELAEALDGAVGASRAACDAGYQPHSRQVGLTGKVITPKLYIACGIDGAIQHLAGMRGSKVIVAINTKKEAPIFNVANYGCVADLFTLVPLLTQEFRKLRHHA
ncbi:MAG TPA: electron transfer flavoprotein subunit alpha/FixB family protein [Phycisphaerae bacterium]